MPYKDEEKRKAHRRAYYYKNRKHVLDAMKLRYESNRQEILAHNKAYRNSRRAKRTTIYALCEPAGEIRYVGKTVYPMEWRLRDHINRASHGRDTTHKTRWIRRLLQHGYKPTVLVLEECEGDGCEEERFHIRLAVQDGLRLVNLTAGGDGTLGYSPTEKTRQLLRAIHKGRHKGVPRSPETRAKISASLKRKIENDPDYLQAQREKIRRVSEFCHTPEAIAKMAESQRKRLADPAVRANLAEKSRITSKGRRHTEETKHKISVAHKTSPRAIAARKILNQKTPEILRQSNIGRKQSPEWVARRMASRKEALAKRCVNVAA
jgi:hypothetical protein